MFTQTGQVAGQRGGHEGDAGRRLDPLLLPPLRRRRARWRRALYLGSGQLQQGGGGLLKEG